MTDAALQALLKTAFLPFAKGFADEPSAVKLTIACTPYQVEGTLTLASADYDLVHQGSMAEVDLGRAFRVLASWNDPRSPSLAIESAADA